MRFQTTPLSSEPDKLWGSLLRTFELVADVNSPVTFHIKKVLVFCNHNPIERNIIFLIGIFMYDNFESMSCTV